MLCHAFFGAGMGRINNPQKNTKNIYRYDRWSKHVISVSLGGHHPLKPKNVDGKRLGPFGKA